MTIAPGNPEFLGSSSHHGPGSFRCPGLYVHVPFCATKCPYCDFYSVTRAPESLQARMVASLLDELTVHLTRRPKTWTRFDSLYLGGGTPSVLTPGLLRKLLAGLSHRLETVGSELREITCEINPADIDREMLSVLAEAGVTRISLGVQSFRDEHLALLGRRHDAILAAEAIESLRSFSGWQSTPALCLDLIHDIPGSNLVTWDRTLRSALAWAPDHVSCYALTISEKTPFGRWVTSGKLVLPGDDERAEQYLLAHQVLAEEAGFDHYEVSNYARTPLHRAVHNVKYWTGFPYLGIGPSAHSFDGARRWWNVSDIGKYLHALTDSSQHGWEPEQGLWAGWEPIGPEEAALEALGLGLRWTGGVSRDLVARSFGDSALDVLEHFVADGLLQHKNRYFIPTVRGLARADGIARAVLAAIGQ